MRTNLCVLKSLRITGPNKIKKILRSIKDPTYHGTEHDFPRDTEKETNTEIGCCNSMDEFPNTCMKTTGNSQFTLKSLLPVD